QARQARRRAGADLRRPGARPARVRAGARRARAAAAAQLPLPSAGRPGPPARVRDQPRVSRRLPGRAGRARRRGRPGPAAWRLLRRTERSLTMTYVIAGGGLAAAKAAEALREQGYDGRLVVVAAEQHLPYERPPLSKSYLQGKSEREKIFVHDASWYDEHRVEVLTGTCVTAIDRAEHEVALSTGERLGYAKLLLATGATPRLLPGDALYLRTVDDSERIRE